jgi:hypothetical protein
MVLNPFLQIAAFVFGYGTHGKVKWIFLLSHAVQFFCKVRKILLNPAGDKWGVGVRFCVIRIGAIVYIRVLVAIFKK